MSHVNHRRKRQQGTGYGYYVCRFADGVVVIDSPPIYADCKTAHSFGIRARNNRPDHANLDVGVYRVPHQS